MENVKTVNTEKPIKKFLRAMLITALCISLIVIGFVGAAIFAGENYM